MNTGLLRHAVATVLTVYGIETQIQKILYLEALGVVATVLTVYGIETLSSRLTYINALRCNSAYRLRY